MKKLTAEQNDRIAANVSTWRKYLDTPADAVVDAREAVGSALSTVGRAQALLVACHTDPECPRTSTLSRAVELGADAATVAAIASANRVSTKNTIVLPAHRYEGLSRGRGWARSGKGDSAIWGDRVDGGYRVGPGKWSVGATDGFNRKDSTEWIVKHIQVGGETWTVAN